VRRDFLARSFTPEAITARQDSVLFIFPPLTLVILCPLAYSLWSPPPLCSGSRVHPVSTACAAFSLVSLPLKYGAEACSCAERFGYRLSVLALKSPRVFIFLAGARRQGCFFSREVAWNARFQVHMLHDGSARLVFFCCCLPLRFVSPCRGAHCLSSLLGFVPFCRRSFLLDFYSVVCGL
jgi:hypothetical protein